MASTSGSQLLPWEAVDVLRAELLPLATVLTPNIPEANLLVGLSKDESPKDRAAMIDLAKKLHALGPKYVLLKGGHFQPDFGANPKIERSIVDIVYDGSSATTIEKAFIKSRNTHGTGCSLASAVACNIAKGDSVPTAIEKACQYVEAGIKTSIDRGQGSGPINHFHSTYSLPFAPGRFVDYLLARSDVKHVWDAHVYHPFVEQLAKNTLDIDKFKHYLIQDYLFLVGAVSKSAESSANCLQDGIRPCQSSFSCQDQVNGQHSHCEACDIVVNFWTHVLCRKQV